MDIAYGVVAPVVAPTVVPAVVPVVVVPADVPAVVVPAVVVDPVVPVVEVPEVVVVWAGTSLLTRVIAPVPRLARKTFELPTTVSDVRLVAFEVNATQVPSSEIEGFVLELEDEDEAVGVVPVVEAPVVPDVVEEDVVEVVVPAVVVPAMG